MRIQKCGGHASRLVNTGVGWSQNGRVAMWSARPGELGGVRGGTGARFVARYPRALGGPGGINALNLSTRTIYLGTWTGQVWAAALPHALR